MIKSKHLLAAAVAVASTSAFAQSGSFSEHFETPLYVDLATQFLDRGQVSGDAAVMAGFNLDSASGFYAGVHAIGGGFNEVDYVLGYAGEFSGVGVDVSYADLNFPSIPTDDAEELLAEVTLGDFALFYVTGLTDGANDEYDYVSVSYAMDDWTFTYGIEDAGNNAATDTKYSHVNVDYALTDELTATFVVPVDSEASSNAAGEDELQFVFTYSVPLD